MSNEDSSYEEILDRQWDDIGEPTIIPGGKWVVKVRQVVVFKPKTVGQSERGVIRLTPIEPLDDVDADALDALGDGYDVTVNELEYQKFLETGRDLGEWKSAFAKFGVDVQGKTWGEVFKEIRGKKAVAVVGKRTYTNKDGVVVPTNTVSGFISLDA